VWLRLRLHLRRSRRSDRRTLEDGRRLRQDTAVQSRSSFERSGCLGQEDALHLSNCAHSDRTGDLPKDFVRRRLVVVTIEKSHFRASGELHVPRRLNDVDTGAIEGEVRVDCDVGAKGVDTGRQSLAADEAAFEIFAVGVGACGGVGVRSLHVADRGGQDSGSGSDVVRRIGMARDLRGCRSLSIKSADQAKASNGARSDGRDGNVTGDNGVGHGGDAGLCEDGVVTGSSKVDRIDRGSSSGSIDHGGSREQKEIQLHGRFGWTEGW
jgi:hypothetical protein